MHFSIPRKRALGVTVFICIWFGPIPAMKMLLRGLTRSLDLNPLILTCLLAIVTFLEVRDCTIQLFSGAEHNETGKAQDTSLMLIKHKFLSEQLEGNTHQKKEYQEDCGHAPHRTRASNKNVRANDETGRGEVAIFHNISKERLQLNLD